MLTGTQYQCPSTRQAAPDLLRTDHVCPMAGLGDVVELQKLVVLDQLFVFAAGVELRGARRIAAEDALHDRRARGLAERDGAVDPVVALPVIVEGLGKLRHRRATSPFEVHQWMTSRSVAEASDGAMSATASAVVPSKFLNVSRIDFPPLRRCRSAARSHFVDRRSGRTAFLVIVYIKCKIKIISCQSLLPHDWPAKRAKTVEDHEARRAAQWPRHRGVRRRSATWRSAPASRPQP